MLKCVSHIPLFIFMNLILRCFSLYPTFLERLASFTHFTGSVNRLEDNSNSCHCRFQQLADSDSACLGVPCRSRIYINWFVVRYSFHWANRTFIGVSGWNRTNIKPEPQSGELPIILHPHYLVEVVRIELTSKVCKTLILTVEIYLQIYLVAEQRIELWH